MRTPSPIRHRPVPFPSFATAAFATVMLVTTLRAATAGAGGSAIDWLARMQDAAQNLSYQGTFVYVHQGQLETMRVTRRVSNGSVRERLTALSGAPREIIRNDRQIWCYLPDQSIGVHEYRQVAERTFPSLLPEDREDLERMYTVRFGSRAIERIADREARQIVIQPKDRLRYGYELWVDTETGLLLRAILARPDGTAIEQYAFAELDLESPVPDEALEPLNDREALQWYGIDIGEPETIPAESAWEFTSLPSGFRRIYQGRRTEPMSGLPVDHFVFSDGLAAVSLFAQRLPNAEQPAFEGMGRMGAVHAFGRRIGQFQVTVIGEVPNETVSLIGRALKRR